MPSVNVIGAVLSKLTKKGKIVFLGNVLPIHENPLRVAEEIAMIDCISGGRVVCGFVRGLGQESWATNTNPIYNRERFEEAHDLIVKTWTTPGPFRWEGKHFHFRAVNPWAMPLQKPHPPVWIPGVASPESVIFAARHKYPYIALAPPLDLMEEIYELYDRTAEEEGIHGHFGQPRVRHSGKRVGQRRAGLRGGQEVLLAVGNVLRGGAQGVAGAAGVFEPGRQPGPAAAAAGHHPLRERGEQQRQTSGGPRRPAHSATRRLTPPTRLLREIPDTVVVKKLTARH